MNGYGWIMMLLNWGIVLGLTVFCLVRVIRLRSEQAAHIHPLSDIDTGDLSADGHGPRGRKGH